MNPPARPVLLLAALMAGAALAHATAPSPRIQQRIDALLKARLKPEPLPVTPPNPFQMISGAVRESPADHLGAKSAVGDDSPAPAGAATLEFQSRELAAANPTEVLVACATRLKLGGILILKDQMQVVVNGVPRKEGDAIAVEWNNSIVTLRVVRLLPGQLVLRYGESEATVKF